MRNIYFLVAYFFLRVFRRMKIKYRIIIINLYMRKCEIVKKIEIRIYVMIKKNYCVYVMLKKMWCVLDYLLDILQTAVMRFRLLQHITLKWKNVFLALEIAERLSGKFQGKNQSQIFDQIVSVILRWAKPKKYRAKISHKKYRWFCGERNQKTTEPKFSIKSIGGFAVSDSEKPPQRKKKYRWFYR